MHTVIAPRSFAPAFVLEEGETVRIEDIDGMQAADVIITSADDPGDWMSCIYTQLLNQTHRVTRGHTVYSKRATPLAAIVEDTAGVHWFGGGFCSAETNVFRYGVDAGSCRGNLASSLAEHIDGPFDLELDSCASLFMNIVLETDGSLGIALPTTTAGDFIDLRAERRLIIAVSACPQEHNPCNGFKPTAIGLSTFFGSR